MEWWRTLLAEASSRLRASGIESPEREALWLFEWATDTRYSQWLVQHETSYDVAVVQRFAEAVERRAGREPFHYITGLREFYGLLLEVSPAVLIPRPATESLVEAVLASSAAKPSLVVADIGTGSGAIALALRRYAPSGWTIYGADLSHEAVSVAEANGRRLGLAVEWWQGDLMDALPVPVDVVVANLPYIDPKDRAWLAPELDFEPPTALYADDHGYATMVRLISQAKTARLRPSGRLFLEVGVGQVPGICTRLAESGFGVMRVTRDLEGIERVVEAEKG